MCIWYYYRTSAKKLLCTPFINKKMHVNGGDKNTWFEEEECIVK